MSARINDVPAASAEIYGGVIEVYTWSLGVYAVEHAGGDGDGEMGSGLSGRNQDAVQRRALGNTAWKR